MAEILPDEVLEALRTIKTAREEFVAEMRAEWAELRARLEAQMRTAARRGGSGAAPPDARGLRAPDARAVRGDRAPAPGRARRCCGASRGEFTAVIQGKTICVVAKQAAPPEFIAAMADRLQTLRASATSSSP